MLTLTCVHSLWTIHTQFGALFHVFSTRHLYLSGVWLDVDVRMYTKINLCSKESEKHIPKWLLHLIWANLTEYY